MMKFVTKKTLFLVITTLCLFLGFNFNAYKTSEKERFNSFQRDSECLVIGRLIAAQQHGVFSKGGLPGSFLNIEGLNPEKNKYQEYVNNQYTIYKQNKEVALGKFATYNSQIGGQGILFALIDKVSPLSNKNNLALFRGITSFLTALFFGFFLFWIKRKYDFIPVITSIIFILLSDWITVFSRNIWWSLWSFYVPFIFLLFLFEKKNLTLKTLFKVTFFTFFIKCFFTGYEYITTTILMGSLPIVFYTIEQSKSLKKVIKQFTSYLLGVVSAIITTLFILIFQISNSLGSFKAGVDHIIFSYKKRASGNPEEFSEAYRASLEADTFEVLTIYLESTAFKYGETLITFRQFFKFFFFVSVFLLIISYLAKNLKKVTPLVVISWLSILCPLSWFVIFKPHSFIHVTMNQITWYMPSMLLGFVLVGALISMVFTFLFKKLNVSIKK